VLISRLAGSRGSTNSLAWPVGSALVGAVVYTMAPHHAAYPAVLVTLAAFALGPLLLPQSRPLRTLICPLNWVLAVFWLQLVVIPLLLVYLGPTQGALPFLPSHRAINTALLLSALAFAGFCLGYHFDPLSLRRAARRPRDRTWRLPPRAAAIVFLALGLVGMALAFHSPAALLDYFRKAGHAGVIGPHTPPGAKATLQQTGVGFTLSLVLRPFLGFGVILLWCRWLDRSRFQGGVRPTLYTLAAAIAILVTYATYSYSRAAFVAPIVAILAVYGTRVRRLSVISLLVIASLGFFVLAADRVFRTNTFSLGQALTSHAGSLVKQTDPNAELQTYGSAPQFTGFLLQQFHYTQHLQYGKTLIPSALSPVPLLGKSFRASDGPALYNRLIYGDLGTLDQVIPFQGELFINFYLPGILLAYVCLGILVRRVQRRFNRAVTSIERFVWQYTATWLAFLVIGGLSVVSQIFIYFFWPAYVLALAARRPWAGLGASSGGRLLPRSTVQTPASPST
jgi:hypothetical protein